jgi:hypothetical protein
MPKAAAIIAKVDKLLNSLGGYTGVVYKRYISRGNGDSITGKGVVVSSIDTRLAPQPLVLESYGDSVAYKTDAGSYFSDVKCIVSPSAISKADASSATTTIVVKTGLVEEEYSIVDVNSTVFGGVVVLLELRLRSRKR